VGIDVDKVGPGRQEDNLWLADGSVVAMNGLHKMNII
jgi:hypothetical protein